MAAEMERRFPAAPLVPLKSVAKVLSGITPKENQKVKERPPPEGSLGVIAITQIRGGTIGAPEVYLHSRLAHAVNDRRLRAGDVLLSIKTRLGKIALVPARRDDLCAGDALVILRPDPARLASEFLMMLLQGELHRRWLQTVAPGSTGLKRVTAGVIEQMLIPLPSLALQAHSLAWSVRLAPADPRQRATNAATAEEPAASDVYTPDEGQGFQADPRLRQAVEDAAMNAAEAYFEAYGYDVVRKGRPFDLLCTRNEEVLYVEVKGTTGSAARVVLTHGEVKHNRRYPGAMALYVLHSLQVVKCDGALSVRGGTEDVVWPWRIHEEPLEPLSYWYRRRDGRE